MRRIHLPLLAVLAGLVLVPAARAADPVPPTATTSSATAVTVSGAQLRGTVNPKGTATTYQFEYGTSSSYGLTTDAKEAGDGTASVAAAADISGLTSATTYHYRVVATNAAGVARGSDRTFTTSRSTKAPTISVRNASVLTATGAKLNALVSPQGLATTVSFEYGTTTGYGKTAAGPSLAAGFSSRGASATIGDLQPYTTYHFRAVATNAQGVTRGPDRSFRTLRAPAEIVLDPVSGSVPWKTNVTISGKVSGTAVGGIGLAVQRSDFPYTTTYTTRTFAASSSGTFNVSIGPLYSSSRLRVIARSPYTTASGWVTVMNSVSVGLKVGGKTRTHATLSGRTFPQLPKGTATLQRLSAKGKWTRVARTSVTDSGQFASRYSFRVKRPRATRSYRVVVVPHDAGAHETGISREVRVAGRR
jgi:hypothetical protein